MKHTYWFITSATSPAGQRVEHLRCVMAESPEEAAAAACGIAMELFPPQEGWSGHGGKLTTIGDTHQ